MGGIDTCSSLGGFSSLLAKKKGSQFDGKGFKMLAALNQHCHPDSVAYAFTIQMLLFNDNMTESEEIMALCLHFDGMVNDIVWCKLKIPLILMVMFFLRSLHPCYDNLLLEQFWSWYKDPESASLDSIVADAHYHDEFKLVGSDKKSLARKM